MVTRDEVNNALQESFESKERVLHPKTPKEAKQFMKDLNTVLLKSGHNIGNPTSVKKDRLRENALRVLPQCLNDLIRTTHDTDSEINQAVQRALQISILLETELDKLHNK